MFVFDTVSGIARIRRKQPGCHGCGLCSDFATGDAGRDLIHAGYEWLIDTNISQIPRFRDAFNEFASRVYWTRLWIVQELFLAQNASVLCGDHSLPMNDFLFAYCILESIHGPGGRDCSPLATLAQQKGTLFPDKNYGAVDFTFGTLIKGQTKNFDLGHTGFLLSTLGCSNPLDRVYGILKLIQWPKNCGPPSPDYSTTLSELIIDVTDRLGRNRKFPLNLSGVCDGLGLAEEIADMERPAMDILRRRGDWFNGDNTQPCVQMCDCDSSVTPTIAMTKTIWEYGIVYQGEGGSLFITIYTRFTPSTHAKLEFDYVEDTNQYVTLTLTDAVPQSGPCYFIFWSSVKIEAGDIIAEIDSNQRPQKDRSTLDSTPRFCVVLRDAGHDYYKIRGQAEIYGDSQWCLEATKCSDRIETKACHSHNRRKKHFMLCLDAQDAISYLMLGRRGHLMQAGDAPTFEEITEFCYGWSNIGFTRTRFSSYAIEVDTTEGKDLIGRAPFEISGVPTTDKRLTICANCGGRFKPEDPHRRDKGSKDTDRNSMSTLSKFTKKLRFGR